jgi:hypothetical protein
VQARASFADAPAPPAGFAQPESFLRGGGQTVVEGDQVEGRRSPFRGNERRGELQRVRRAQRMHAQEANSSLTDAVVRVHFVPPVGELGKSASVMAVSSGAPSLRSARRAVRHLFASVWR